MSNEGLETFLGPDGSLSALVIRANFGETGISFLTPLRQTQQLGFMRRPRGYRVEPHEHTPQRREITDTNEVLFVRSGLIEVALFDAEHRCFASFRVGPSEAVLLASGGHGVTFLEESDVIEVKQGPYTEQADKLRFEPNP